MWLSVILGDAELPTPSAIDSDPRLRLAVRLAVAEARAAKRREVMNAQEAEAEAAHLADEADQRTVWEKAAELSALLAGEGGLDAFKLKVQQDSRYVNEVEGSLRLARKAWISVERERLAVLAPEAKPALKIGPASRN